MCNSKMNIELEVRHGMKENNLKIKKRGDDGNKVISLRISVELLHKLDAIAKETNYSRNELINLILEHNIDHIEIEP